MPITQERAEEFLRDLAEVMRKHQVSIYACSCCDGINVYFDGSQRPQFACLGACKDWASMQDAEQNEIEVKL